jgi:hypothetical protein
MVATVSPSQSEERKRAVRRTTLWLALLAFAFYGGFILMSVIRAH